MKKLHIQNNTGICNPKNTKSLIESSNILKASKATLLTDSLVDYYCIINAATEEGGDESLKDKVLMIGYIVSAHHNIYDH